MEPREPRNKVLVRARMHCGSQWHDVCILNFSAHGLGLTCDAAPPRGTYIEVRRGPFVIVARVAWSKGHRFGARTQDPIAHVAIVGSIASGRPGAEGGLPVERRSPSRTSKPVVRESRDVGRSIEFAVMAMVLAAGSAVLADSAYTALSSPLAAVSAALNGR